MPAGYHNTAGIKVQRMKKGSIKNNRINGEVLRELSSIIANDVKDPRIDPFVSVTRAEVSPDLQFCKCYVSLLNSEHMDETIAGLENAKGFIRTELAHRINLRKTPFLTFAPDRNIEYAIEMSKRIEQLAREGGMASGKAEETEEDDF